MRIVSDFSTIVLSWAYLIAGAYHAFLTNGRESSAGGERKRGQWLSTLVRAMHEAEQTAQASDVEQLKFALAGMIGQQKQLEGRMLQMERQVAALISQ